MRADILKCDIFPDETWSRRISSHIATTNPTTSTKCRWILLRGAGTDRSVAVGVKAFTLSGGRVVSIHDNTYCIYRDLYRWFNDLWILQRQLYADTWWHTWRLHIDMDVHVFEWCVHVLFDNVWIFGLADASGILVVIRREAMLKWKMMFGIWSGMTFEGLIAVVSWYAYNIRQHTTCVLRTQGFPVYVSRFSMQICWGI